DCKPGCDCDRFMEFWNLVFTQFDNDGNNNYTRLSKPNIDTGMGLERLACLMQGVNNLFEVDTVKNIMQAISDIAGVRYGEGKSSDISLRVITDHIRSTSFMICDGIVPSNEGRGYVLRRLLRRAARHGRLLGIRKTFLSDIVDVVARENYSEYPELTEKLAYIKKVVSVEEERFAATIDSGLSILEDMIKDTKEKGGDVLSGSDVFKLNDTFGFPIDLTREIASEKGLSIDEEGYTELMKEQKKRAREARLALGDFGWTEDALSFIDKSHKTEFTGYTETESDAKVIAIIDLESKEAIGSVSEGGKAIILLDRTPFYAESGGQVGDTGYIIGCNGKARVSDTKKYEGIYVQMVEMESGIISVDEDVKAVIDSERRNAIKRNHSAAHMLQAALRRVLGAHVEQAGSYVDEHRVRFDFSHFEAMTEEEIKKVETEVNAEILKGEEIETVVTDINTAKTMGAMALFGEKYGDIVRVVKMGDYSTEFCGGTHLDNTAKAGLFKIISESSVAAGVRRIEGTTGLGVLELLAEREELISETAKELKAANRADIAKRAAQVQNELKSAKHDIESLEGKLAAGKTADIMKNAKDVDGLTVLSYKTSGESLDVARTIGDNLKAQDENIVAVISVNIDGKINFVGVCGKNAVARGAHAGNILKQVSQICGGNGGGRPDSATSGGKDASKIDEALASVETIVKAMLK
ncbi:MAG: alanine--tRNA ligase, partial [Ruminococcaceae bacterium]|nr:alanine--tRNA ligase [Oscillospiraceae bacterium]